jgi:hypothetical protein
MYARASRFVNAEGLLGAAKLLACAGVCALLSGCVGNPFEDAKVDPRSPIAKEVAKSVRSDAAYPTFAATPAVPKDVRPHKQYGVAAAQIDKDAAALEQATADNTWALPKNTEAYAAEARAAAGPDLPAATSAADTEAFAQALRKRATPPPPAKH